MCGKSCLSEVDLVLHSSTVVNLKALVNKNPCGPLAGTDMWEQSS